MRPSASPQSRSLALLLSTTQVIKGATAFVQVHPGAATAYARQLLSEVAVNERPAILRRERDTVRVGRREVALPGTAQQVATKRPCRCAD